MHTLDSPLTSASTTWEPDAYLVVSAVIIL